MQIKFKIFQNSTHTTTTRKRRGTFPLHTHINTCVPINYSRTTHGLWENSWYWTSMSSFNICIHTYIRLIYILYIHILIYICKNWNVSSSRYLFMYMSYSTPVRSVFLSRYISPVYHYPHTLPTKLFKRDNFTVDSSWT